MTSAPALLAARAAERPEGPPPTTSTWHLSCTGILLAGSSTTSLSSSISATTTTTTPTTNTTHTTMTTKTTTTKNQPTNQ